MAHKDDETPPPEHAKAVLTMMNPIALERMVGEWLCEDIPSFDVGGAVVGNGVVEAVILAKSDLVVSGFPFAEAILRRLGCKVTWLVDEGSHQKGSSNRRIPMGIVRGPAHAVLQAERTILEVLCRSSSCASEAWRSTRASKSKNPAWGGRIAATRKTTPGLFRAVEKYGVIIGGADPHRYSLSSMTMLKDNHIDVAGNITKAVQMARRVGGFSVMIEVECRSLEEALEAACAGANVVMLDNFKPQAAGEAAKTLKLSFPSVLVECSGGITFENVADYAHDAVDVVSMGRLTHGARSVDISMKINKFSSRM